MEVKILADPAYIEGMKAWDTDNEKRMEYDEMTRLCPYKVGSAENALWFNGYTSMFPKS